MALGDSFSPSAANQQDPSLRKRRTPVQQALQTVSLQAPVARGSAALSQRLLSGQGGAGAAAAGASQPGTNTISSFVNALMGNTGSSTSGFQGGGFGNAGPVAGAGGGTTRPVRPPAGAGAVPGTLPGVGPGGGPKPPGGGGGFQLPGAAQLPSKISNVVGGVKDALSGAGGGGFKLPGGLKAPALPKKKPAMEAPEPGSPNWKPPINPNIPGGGLLEPPKPPVITPPPAVNFGGGGPSFSTPTGGFTGAGTSGLGPTQSAYNPSGQYQGAYVQPSGPAPQGTAGTNKGGVYYNAQGVPAAFGPSGPPPGASRVVYY
jgi:hypothetical protein